MPHNRTSLRLPPDGAGKAVSIAHFLHVDYTGLSSNDIQVGNTVVGQTSGVIAEVIKVKPATISSGSVDVILHQNYADDSFTVGEVISINSTMTATVQGQESYFTNQTQIVGQNNPTQGQYIDEKGAAFVRYAEGAVHFDAFGFMQTTNLHSIGLYAPRYDELPFSMGTVQAGAGDFTYDPDVGSVYLTCTTANGDYISRRSNKYHQYQPGIGHLALLTVSVGDTGKENVTRRWGYFDDNNGVFFELQGTELNVVLRRNLGSGVEEERVPQSAWNSDRLDGSGLSQMEIDVSKNNIWWIDLAYLGAGRVRTGAFSQDGERVVSHVFENTNKNPFSYMRTASLPINVEQFNTGIAASTSQLNFQLGAVFAENKVPRVFNSFGTRFEAKTVTGPVPQHLVSMRVADTYKGIDNRLVVLPHAINVIGIDTTSFEMKPVRVCMAFMGPLTAPDWNPYSDPSSGVEISTNSTDSLVPGTRVVFTGVGTNGMSLDLSGMFFYEGNATLNKLASGFRPWVGIYVSPVNPADEIEVFADLVWKEYE